MTVASIRSATATVKPICWNMIRSPRAKPAKWVAGSLLL